MQELEIAVPRGLDGDARALTFRVDGDVGPLRPTPDLALACHLLPAMRRRHRLVLDGTPGIDPGPLQERYAAWFPQLAATRVEGSPRPDESSGPGTRTAAFFSGGVDSFHTLEERRDEIDVLLCVLGFDIRADQRRLWEETRRMARSVAEAYAKDLILVETDLRRYLDPVASWEVTHGAAMAAVAHLLAHELRRVLVSSSFSTTQPIRWGSHPELDPLWSAPSLRVENVGAETPRLEKLRRLASSEVALEHLRVCWRNPDQAYNCGRCSKCVRTRLTLDALGLAGRSRSFGGRLAVRDLRRLHPRSRTEAYFLEEVADEYDRRAADTPLADALREWLRVHWGRARRAPAPRTGSGTRQDKLVVGAPRLEVDETSTRLRVDVRRGATEATFEAVVPLGGREPTRVGDALLLWFVLPAMRSATGLEIQAPVSPELLRQLDRAQEIWAHLPEYEGHEPVPVDAPARAPAPPSPLDDPARPWASAFSCGVDSFDTALRHRDRIAYLVTVHGITQLVIDPEDIAVTSRWLQAGARAVGLPLLEVSTNYRQVLVERLGCRWDYTFILSKYGLAHFLHPHVGGLLIGGESSYRDLLGVKPTSKYNPLLDAPTSTRDVRIRIDGLTRSRLGKLEALAPHPEVLDALWVCHQRYANDYRGGRNCGTCEKCVRTLSMLRILGLDDRGDAFDAPFDVERLRATRLPRGTYSPSRRMFYRQMLAAVRGREDLRELEEALEHVVDGFPAADATASVLADALATRYPLLASSTAALRRTVGRWTKGR